MATTATSSALNSGASGTADEPSIETDTTTKRAIRTGHDAVESLGTRLGYAQAPIMGAVRMIGAALIGIAVLIVVLVEVFSLDAIANISADDPFGGIVESLQSTGSAALGLLVIGLLVLAANRVMGFFGGGGF